MLIYAVAFNRVHTYPALTLVDWEMQTRRTNINMKSTPGPYSKGVSPHVFLSKDRQYNACTQECLSDGNILRDTYCSKQYLYSVVAYQVLGLPLRVSYSDFCCYTVSYTQQCNTYDVILAAVHIDDDVYTWYSSDINT